MKSILINLSDEQFQLVKDAAQHDGVKVTTKTREMLLCWAYSHPEKIGKLFGGLCAVCKGAGAIFFFRKHYLCNDCAHLDLAILNEKLDERDEDDGLSALPAQLAERVGKARVETD